MTVTDREKVAPWLMLVFSLPANRASQRVEIWRKLQRTGALPLRSSGYVLPHTPANQEKLEWLATAIRNYKGQASVIKVQGFDDLPDKELGRLFQEARTRDYEGLMLRLRKTVSTPAARRSTGELSRLRRQFLEIAALDFFDSPMRARVEAMLARVDDASSDKPHRSKASEFVNRTWITRPRPGIDRVSSAWLIRQFIDPRSRFVFDIDPDTHPAAIPFDMFVARGFGHRGDDCTFETLCKEFAIRDARVKHIAQIIHDADLGDGKFGRTEGDGLDRVLNGWAAQDLSDDELLRRGMELIEGLYRCRETGSVRRTKE